MWHAGREAGTLPDEMTKDDKNSGAKTGENVGKLLGTVVAVGALIQNAEAEDPAFQERLNKKGYIVLDS
ncbi:MAG: hypothetical protein OEY80_04375 [Nitrospirota bacterium]|nr:hypothetical protein [Nitrospirota bacterium]